MAINNLGGGIQTLLERRRMLMGGKDNILPQGYTQIDWLTNNGSAWFGTDIYRDDTSQLVDIDTNIKVIANDGYMGTDGGCFFRTLPNGHWGNISADTGVSYTIGTPYHLLMYRDSITDQSLYIDDVKISTTQRALSGRRQVYLFAIIDSIYYQMKCSLGRTKIYKARELVADYVPCKDPNGVYGMYCLIRGQFYGSVTSTPFTGE